MNRRGRPPYPDVLTPRQWQVLALLREGLSNEQIALRLGISVDGVKFHVSEILGKLGVGSRNEAAQWDGEQRQPAPSARLAGRWRSTRTSPPGPLSTKGRGGMQQRRRNPAAINSRGRLSYIARRHCRSHGRRLPIAS
jgi:DNA-binding CsgD family transcriptional regulator